MANVIKPRSSLIIRYPAEPDNIIYAGAEYIIPFEFDEIGLSNPSQLNIYVSYKKASTDDVVELQYTTDTKDYVIDASVGDVFTQAINADLDNYGYLKITRTIIDVEYIYIYRKTEVSQLKDFNTNSYSMASIGEAINKLTMIQQEQGGLTPAIRIPETVVVENNISAPLKYNAYEPNCLLGTKDDPSEIVAYRPSGLSLTFDKSIIVDNEGNEKVVNNGFLSAHTLVFRDNINTASFYIPARLCTSNEDVQDVIIQSGKAMSMSLEEITPSSDIPDNETPAQSVKFLKINGAGLKPHNDYIYINFDDNNNDWYIGCDEQKIIDIINTNIPPAPTPSEEQVYVFNRLLSATNQTRNIGLKSYIVAFLRVYLPEQLVIADEVGEGIVSVLGSFLSQEQISAIREGNISDIVADLIISSIGKLTSYLPMWLQFVINTIAGGDITDNTKVTVVDCIIKAGRFLSLNEATGQLDFTLLFGKHLYTDGADTLHVSDRNVTTKSDSNWLRAKTTKEENNFGDEISVDTEISHGAIITTSTHPDIITLDQSYVPANDAKTPDALKLHLNIKDLSSLKGKDGDDGVTPHIGNNGNWFIGETDTNIKAQGPKGDPGAPGKDGDDGVTPHIGNNGNWFIGETDTNIKAQGPKGDPGAPGKDGDDGHNPSPSEIQVIVKEFIDTPQNPVNVSIQTIVEDTSNSSTSNTLKPVLYSDGENIYMTGGVDNSSGSTQTGIKFLDKVINGIKDAMPLITAVTSVVAPEVAAAIALIDDLTDDQKTQASSGNVSEWEYSDLLKLLPNLIEYMPSSLQAIFPGNKKQLDNDVNGSKFVYTFNGRSYVFDCPDGSIDINRHDDGKRSSTITLNVSEDFKDSVRGQDGKDGKDGKDYFSVRDLPQIITNLGAMGSTEVLPMAAGLMVGVGGGIINDGSGEPVDNSPMVPVPSEVVVKNMPTYDVEKKVVGIVKYLGSATFNGETIDYLCVTERCELLLGTKESSNGTISWQILSGIPTDYTGTAPLCGSFSYSSLRNCILIVCSNINYIFIIRVGDTFESLNFYYRDTSPYCPAPYGQNKGQCCAWSNSSAAFIIAPSNNESTGNLLRFSVSSTGTVILSTDNDFIRSNYSGSFDFVYCDLVRNSNSYESCSDILLCISTTGYVYRKRYVSPQTFTKIINIQVNDSTIDVNNLASFEVLGRVLIFSPIRENEANQQIIIYRYKTMSDDTLWIYRQLIFHSISSSYNENLTNAFTDNLTPGCFVNDCCVRANPNDITAYEGRIYTNDGKCWWYRPAGQISTPASLNGYLVTFASNGEYNTVNITGANNVHSCIDKECAVDDTGYFIYDTSTNNWIKQSFGLYDNYQYEVVKSLYSFTGYLSALVNLTVNNILRQFFIWTEDGAETWNFKTVNDGTDNEYIDCIYASAGVLFIPKEWTNRYALLSSLNESVIKIAIENESEYTHSLGGFVIQNDNSLEYCLLVYNNDDLSDTEVAILRTRTPENTSSWVIDEDFFGTWSSAGLDVVTEEKVNSRFFVTTGMMPVGTYGNANVLVGVLSGAFNGVLFWNNTEMYLEEISIFNSIGNMYGVPVGGATFDEKGFALLVNIYTDNTYQKSQIYYYSLPEDYESSTFSSSQLMRNCRTFDIYSPRSFVPFYKPERLIYNRLTGLWTLFYKRQTDTPTANEPPVIYTASNLVDLADGTRSSLEDAQDINLDTLIHNQYGFYAFGGGKVMLSTSPKNIFDLLSFLNYKTKHQQIEIDNLRQNLIEVDENIDNLRQNLDNLRQNLIEVEENYVQKTTTINSKALSNNVTLTASDVGALATNGTATRAISDQLGRDIASTYTKQDYITQMLDPQVSSGLATMYSEYINKLTKKVIALCNKANVSISDLPPTYN